MSVSATPLNPPLHLNVSRVERTSHETIAVEFQHSNGHQVAIGMTNQAATVLLTSLMRELDDGEKAPVQQAPSCKEISNGVASFQLHSITAKIDGNLGALVMETQDHREVSFSFPIENLAEVARLFFAAAAKLSASVEVQAKNLDDLQAHSA